jgi:hypothetical protein
MAAISRLISSAESELKIIAHSLVCRQMPCLHSDSSRAAICSRPGLSAMSTPGWENPDRTVGPETGDDPPATIAEEEATR